MDSTRLSGKVALITGASRGIGRAIALRLAREGAAVVVNYAGNTEAASTLVAEVQAGGGRAVAVQADVGRLADVARLFDEATRRLGKIDILVNNAGVFFTKPLAEVTEEEFDRLFAVNVKGAYFCCQRAALQMADGGRIVNLSSSTTALMLPRYSAYVATKGAVEQFSHVLAKELGPRGITVNVVSPGPTDTELFSSDKTEEDKQRFAQMAALGRLGQPDDIADVVAFLVSDDARWVTGQNLRANGGLI
ncbi:MAG: SDR family oxidoreductase [Isosphaeraceae bacterium]|nr:SDR family oxidoreductase [Isosphaeraceae bacterium]